MFLKIGSLMLNELTAATSSKINPNAKCFCSQICTILKTSKFVFNELIA